MSTDQPPATEVPSPMRRRRWVKWLKRAFLAATIFVLGFVGWEYLQWQLTWREGNAKLQPLIAELDATDPDWRAADLCAKRNARLAPPEANTAEQALAAVKLLPKEELDRDGEERLSANKLQWWHELPLGTLPTAGELADLSELLKEFKITVEAGKRLREFPGSGFRVTYSEPSWMATLLPNTYHIPLLASLLDREAFRQAAGGDGDGSAATLLAMSWVGQGIGDEPFLISQLVRVTLVAKAARALERTLGLGTVTDSPLAELQQTFDMETTVARMVAGLRGERGGLHRLLENIGSGDLHPEDLEASRPRTLGTLGLLEYRDWRSRIPAQQARSLDLYNRLIAASRMPFGPPRAQAFDELEMEIDNVSREQETWIVRLFLPAGRKINDAETRLTALLRCAVAGIACERYRLKNGQFPKSLAELPKELLMAIPEDPFTGKPLLFNATDTGIILYTVGSDLRDNGGNVNSKYTDEPGTDIGFTLLDPKHRRQLPKPQEE